MSSALFQFVYWVVQTTLLSFNYFMMPNMFIFMTDSKTMVMKVGLF